MSSPAGYSRAQIVLHWLVLVLLVPQYLFNDAIGAAFRAFTRGEPVPPSVLVFAHVALGMAIAVAVIWRLVLRVRRGAPPPPEAEHPALKLVAKITHGALYLLLILLPVSGGMAWFAGIRAAAGAHEVMTGALLALTVLHVLGALYHEFVLKTGLMARMKRPA